MKRTGNQNCRGKQGLPPICYFVLGVMIGVVGLATLYMFLLKGMTEYNLSRKTSYERTLYTGSNFKPETELDFLDGLVVKIDSTVDTNKVGIYNVTYQVFKGKTYEQTVRVIDREPPVIELIGEKTMLIGSISTWKDPGATAYDATEGDLTDKIERKIEEQDDGTYKVLYTVSDSSGYKRTARRTLKLAKGVVCLTFDDGPSTESTPKILDILKSHNIQATFFVLRFNDETKWLVAREMAEGHTVGLHGYSHEYAQIYTDVDTLMDNFYNLDNLIKSEVDPEYQAEFIRFPGGSSNTVSKRYCAGVMSEAVKRVLDEGYNYVDWNVDSRDAAGAETADEVYRNVVDYVQPGRTNVILMHDTNSKPYTVEALDIIIKALEEKGYVFEPITEHTQIVRHSVAN